MFKYRMRFLKNVNIDILGRYWYVHKTFSLSTDDIVMLYYCLIEMKNEIRYFYITYTYTFMMYGKLLFSHRITHKRDS